MTDLILGLDPVDTPIADYERFGIRDGRGRPDRAPRPRHAPRPPVAARLARLPGDAELARRVACEFASREVFRRVLEDVDGLGFEVMAAIEYEIRIWDEEGAPVSSGISYSLNEIGRLRRDSSTSWYRRSRASASSCPRCTPRPARACSS